MWKDSSNSEAAHLHAIRASFGHIYVPVDQNREAWHAGLSDAAPHLQRSSRVYLSIVLGYHCARRHFRKTTPGP